MILVLTPAQQLFLHELGSRKVLPVVRLGFYVGNQSNSVRRLLDATKMLEKFQGRDGNDWVRLTEYGKAFVAGTTK